MRGRPLPGQVPLSFPRNDRERSRVSRTLRIALSTPLALPLAATLCAGAAWLWPEPFSALRPAIGPLLGVVMFGMGMTLTPSRFLAVARRPRLIVLGVALQFLVMPAAAWTVSRALTLPPEVLVGMVLVGASPGGTASNVICYLARGDVALSITLTACSTLVAVLATPFLTLALAGRVVDVPTLDLLTDVLSLVVLPVLVGLAVNHWFHTRLERVRHLFPILSVVSIVLIIGIVVASNAGALSAGIAVLLLAVIVHNVLGLAAGYLVPFALGHDPRTCRTLAIEVGMQNSGLAVALGMHHFSPATALPGVLFSVWHNLSGSALAAWWSRKVH